MSAQINETTVEAVPDPPHLPDEPPNKDSELTAEYEGRVKALLDEWGARQRDIVAKAVAQQSQAWTQENAAQTHEWSVDDATVANDRTVKAATIADFRAVKAATMADYRTVKAAKVSDARAAEAASALAVSQLSQALVGGYVQVSQSSLDRAVTRGTYMTTAAGIIATVYAGLIGAAFSAQKGSTHLNAAALIPAVFLGLAIAFSVAYVAFLKQGEPPAIKAVPANLKQPDPAAFNAQLEKFCEWTYGGVRDRSGYLHMAVYALALGVSLLPVPFLKFSGTADVGIAIASAALFCIAAILLGVKGAWGARAKLLQR